MAPRVAELPLREDGSLVARARAGEHGAFDMLFERHYPRVYNLAARLLGDRDAAEDIAQTAFVRAYASLDRMRDGQSLLAWLYRTTVNLVRDRAKARKRKPWWLFGDIRNADGEVVDEPAPGSESLDPARLVASAERDRALAVAISELPMEFREVVLLHHMEGMDVAGISAVLGVPVGTVKSRLGRGRARLRTALQSWYKDAPEGNPT